MPKLISRMLAHRSLIFEDSQRHCWVHRTSQQLSDQGFQSDRPRNRTLHQIHEWLRIFPAHRRFQSESDQNVNQECAPSFFIAFDYRFSWKTTSKTSNELSLIWKRERSKAPRTSRTSTPPLQTRFLLQPTLRAAQATKTGTHSVISCESFKSSAISSSNTRTWKRCSRSKSGNASFTPSIAIRCHQTTWFRRICTRILRTCFCSKTRPQTTTCSRFTTTRTICSRKVINSSLTTW